MSACLVQQAASSKHQQPAAARVLSHLLISSTHSRAAIHHPPSTIHHPSIASRLLTPHSSSFLPQSLTTKPAAHHRTAAQPNPASQLARQPARLHSASFWLDATIDFNKVAQLPSFPSPSISPLSSTDGCISKKAAASALARPRSHARTHARFVHHLFLPLDPREDFFLDWTLPPFLFPARAPPPASQPDLGLGPYLSSVPSLLGLPSELNTAPVPRRNFMPDLIPGSQQQS